MENNENNENYDVLAEENVNKIINFLINSKIVGIGVAYNEEKQKNYAKFDISEIEAGKERDENSIFKVDYDDVIIDTEKNTILVNLKSVQIKHLLLSIVNNSYVQGKLTMEFIIDSFNLEKINEDKVIETNKPLIDASKKALIESGNEVSNLYARLNEDKNLYSLLYETNNGVIEICESVFSKENIDIFR